MNFIQATLRHVRRRLRAASLVAAACVAAWPACLWTSIAEAQGTATPSTMAPLTLEAAVDLARARHPQVAVARAALSGARARETQAIAGYFPGLRGDFTFAPQTANYAPAPGVRRVLDAIRGSGV